MAVDERRFRLFACNVPVRGASRSILWDLQRGEHYRIDSLLHDVLTRDEGKTVGEIRALYPEDADAIEEALAYLVREELGFWLHPDENIDRFPPLDLAFETPGPIDNAIIDIDRGSRHDYPSLFRQLDELTCQHVQLRFYDEVDPVALDRLLAPTQRGRLRSIQILVKHSAWTDPDFDRLFTAHPRISSIIVHSSPPGVARPGKWPVAHVEQAITSADQCGQIHPADFSICLSTFSEAQELNACLNKKIGIDVAGNIKSCPSCTVSHGHASDTPLRQAVEQDSFHQLARIGNDQVAVCRDCEHRYVCTGCRVFVTDENDPRSKPARCTYDPYTGVWGRTGEDGTTKRSLPIAAGGEGERRPARRS